MQLVTMRLLGTESLRLPTRELQATGEGGVREGGKERKRWGGRY